MLTRPADIARRAGGLLTGRISTLPILALSVHSACNCRCVMCDIWRANDRKQEIPLEALERHVEAIRRLHVRRVMLTGGEPLLHSNLWSLCERLRAEDIRITLVTTGLLIEQHAHEIARLVDELVVSVDGSPEVHDGIRRVKQGFDRIHHGITALAGYNPRPHVIARCVLQKANYRFLDETISAIRNMGVDVLSFLAADVSSTAFNRPEPWSDARRAEIALNAPEVTELGRIIDELAETRRGLLQAGFVQGGVAALRHIRDYYAALLGEQEWPAVRCNAPWVSAVLEADGRVRPCFFHRPYDAPNGSDLDGAINAPDAVAFRRALDVRKDETCRRCVCTLALPVWVQP